MACACGSGTHSNPDIPENLITDELVDIYLDAMDNFNRYLKACLFHNDNLQKVYGWCGGKLGKASTIADVNDLEAEGNSLIQLMSERLSQWKEDMDIFDLEAVVKLWTDGGVSEQVAREFMICNAQGISTRYQNMVQYCNIEHSKANLARAVRFAISRIEELQERKG